MGERHSVQRVSFCFLFLPALWPRAYRTSRVVVCSGRGLGNWTFAVNDSDSALAGKPMCSGSNCELTGTQLTALFSTHSASLVLQLNSIKDCRWM